MTIDIKVPALGDSVTEATVGQWFKKPGEAVAADEPLVELETDKVTVEVPAPSAGILSDIKVPQGTTVAIGAILGSISEGAGGRTGQGTVETGTARCRRCRRKGRAGSRAFTGTARAGSHASACRSAPRCRAAGAARAHRDAARRRRAQADGGEGALARRRIRLRPARPGDEGRRHRRPRQVERAGRGRRLRAADGRAGAADARALARQRRRARGARAHDAAASDDRPPPQGGAGRGGDAHHVQRRGHERHHQAALRVQGPVREAPRREARLHGLLREGLCAGAARNFRRQRRDRRPGHRLQELLSHRRRRRHGQGAGGARGARGRPHVAGRARAIDRRLRQTRARRQALHRGHAGRSPSPSPTAASTARCCRRRSSTRRSRASSACTGSRSARWSRAGRSWRGR